MSDVGLYSALEAELVAALSSPEISGVAVVAPTMSLEDLLTDEGIQKPAVGITDVGADHRQDYGIGRPTIAASVLWEISVVVEDLSGAVESRPLVRSLLETIRDRVHNLQTSTSSGARYRWRSDRYVDIEGGGLIGAVSTFEIHANFGI